MSKADRFLNASFNAAGKVAALPIPSWAKLTIAVVAGATAVFVTQEPGAADIASYIMQSNGG